MEITLYDNTGHPEAYIADDDERSIYLWSGDAVAYIQDEIVYGWNGYHLGYFHGGIVYDTNGRRVGSIREKCIYAVYAEYAKFAKYAKYAKYPQQPRNARPCFSATSSDKGLVEFLEQGAI